MFFKCHTKDQAKDLFRKLSLRLHPDAGGSNELFILLKEAFDDKVSMLASTKKETPKEQAQNAIYERSYEDIHFGDPRLEIIEEIFNFSLNNTKFSTDFVESVEEFLNKRRYITASQYNSLVKIYYSFRMNEDKS